MLLYSKIVLRFFVCIHYIQNMETKLTPDGYNQASSYFLSWHILFPSKLSHYGKWVTNAVLLGQTNKQKNHPTIDTR